MGVKKEVMDSPLSIILDELRQTESQFDSLNKELRDLESQKQYHVREVLRGRKDLSQVTETNRAIKEMRLAISNTKERIGDIRTRLETRLVERRRELIQKKHAELDQHMELRKRYAKRIRELELEISKYRYLITGNKDRSLAGMEDLLPREIRLEEGFAPIDEAIVRVKAEISAASHISTKALLREYLAGETGVFQERLSPFPNSANN